MAIGEKFDVRNVPHKRIELWPEGGMPQVATNLDNQAWIEVFLPTQRVHKAFMIIAPGGAYNWWCWAGEGSRMLEHCLKNGMPAAQLKYRCPRPKGAWFALNAWQDAQRAVRVVRSRAAEFGIDPENIGFNGYSAGGHLTLLAALSSSSNSYARVDATDDVPCHVNWAIPVYPAYVLSDCQGDWSGGSKKGNPLDLELRPEFKFDAKTPPLCFFHGDADEYSAMGSVRVYHRLRTMGIPAELHVMAGMGHVFFRNCRAGDPAAKWLDRIWEWLYAMGINTIHPRTAGAGWRQLIMEYSNPDRDAEFEPGVWTKDAQCVITASKDSAMWFKGEYENFVLDFEYKLDPGANSGVLIYCGDTKNWIPNSVEIQLLDDANPHWKNEPPRNRNGAIYGHLAPKVHNARPAGEWNRMTVWAEGKRIRVAVNNEMAVDCNLDDWKSAKENPDGSKIPPWLSTPLAELPTKGRIGFQGKHGAARPYFRQIYIKKLK